jgi:hypothetical protein
MFILQSTLVLSLVASALAHDPRVHGRRQQASISRSFTGAPYPTGPGFDVPALKDITASSAPEPTVPLPVTFPPGSTPLPLGAGAVGLPDSTSAYIIPLLVLKIVLQSRISIQPSILHWTRFLLSTLPK